MRYVVITGVSTGIGYAATQELIQHGYHVFGSVRKRADGERLQVTLGANFTPLYFDVTDETAIRAAAETVQRAVGDQGLFGLVNNAGIAIGGPLLHLSIDEFRRQFEVNVFGLLLVTQAFAGLLGARTHSPHPPGRIINISSVSGRIAYPFIGPYAASKHAVEAISDSLRRELRLYGVDVIVIEPGAVRTPIWDKLEQVETSRYVSTDYGASLAQMQQQLTA
jgi:NAD(P)-dependent dehydrogenase (short-subunit alcohol dehydrogenase family)